MPFRPGVEKVLQHDGRRGGIETLLARAPVPLATGEPRLRFDRRQPLVLQEHGQTGTRPNRLCERLGKCGLFVGRAVQPARPADDDDVHGRVIAKARDERNRRFERLAGDHLERAREHTGGVAHRHARTPAPDVEGQGTHPVGRVSRPSRTPVSYTETVRRLPLIVLSALLVLPVFTLACRKAAPPAKFKQKLVIIGFDGLDPDLVRKYMGEKKLPNFARLVARGGLYDLATTVSPESPTAWASFATGVNPGKHNIYDFLVRDTRTYLPDLGMVRRTPPKFLFDYVPISKPKVESIRGGTSFWVTAGTAGVRSSILTVPVTYPPEDVPNGELLSGLPLPDIRGTMGTFYYFATDLSRYEEGSTEFGGILKRLIFDGDVAHTELAGPPNPIVRQQVNALRAQATLSDVDKARLTELRSSADVMLPLTVRWARGSNNATVEIDGRSVRARRQ